MTSRSREGAWIEIEIKTSDGKKVKVAPARERGLKSCNRLPLLAYLCRSREGAWIEIYSATQQGDDNTVAPARERGLKLLQSMELSTKYLVAPARERGLKSDFWFSVR